MAFKLGGEKRNFKNSSNVQIRRKKLPKGVLGFANNDNTIDIDESIPEGSSLYRKVKNHEEQHAKDMSEGKLGYTDNNITYMGKTYPRKNGKIKYNGKWTAEGDHSFPWEKRAQRAE